MTQLGQHPVDVVGRGLVVLEEEDRAVEVRLPRRGHRLHQQPEAAAAERSADGAAADRADVRVVGGLRHLSTCLVPEDREQAFTREVRALRRADANQPVAVEGGYPGT